MDNKGIDKEIKDLKVENDFLKSCDSFEDWKNRSIMINNNLQIRLEEINREEKINQLTNELKKNLNSPFAFSDNPELQTIRLHYFCIYAVEKKTWDSNNEGKILRIELRKFVAMAWADSMDADEFMDLVLGTDNSISLKFDDIVKSYQKLLGFVKIGSDETNFLGITDEESVIEILTQLEEEYQIILETVIECKPKVTTKGE